jgi:hypothetical protein
VIISKQGRVPRLNICPVPSCLIAAGNQQAKKTEKQNLENMLQKDELSIKHHHKKEGQTLLLPLFLN